MRMLITALWIARGLLGQQIMGPSITFSPQGAAVLQARIGKVVPGVQLVSVLVCRVVLNGGDVYSLAAQSGISFISPENAGSLVVYTVNHSKLKALIQIAGYSAEGAALIASSGMISAGSKVVFSAIAGHGIADKLVDDLKGKLPDIVGLNQSLVDPSKTIGGEGCASGNILAKFGKGIPTDAKRIELGTPPPPQPIVPTAAPYVPHCPENCVPVVFDRTIWDYAPHSALPSKHKHLGMV